MKALLILLFATCLFGQNIQSQHLSVIKKRVIAGGPCDGTLAFSGSPGSAEDFENSEGTFCTDSTSLIDATSSISTYSTGQAHTGTHAAYFDYAGDEASASYIETHLMAAEDSYTLTFWAYPPSTIVSGNLCVFYEATPTTTPASNAAGRLIWRGTSNTDTRIYLYDYAGGSSQNVTLSDAQGAWLKFELQVTRNDTIRAIISDAGLTVLATLKVASVDRAVEYFRFGDVDNDPDSRPFYIDGVQFNATNP